MEEVRYGWCHDFFDLGSDEKAGNANQLELGKRHNPCGQEAINDIYTQEKRFGEETKASMNLNEPVEQDSSH